MPALSQPFRVSDRQGLRPGVGRVDKPRALARAAAVNSPLQAVAQAASLHRSARPPPDGGPFTQAQLASAGSGLSDESH